MDKFIGSDTQRTPLFWVALLRIMIGVLLLTTWESNLSKGFYTPDGLQNFFTNIFPQSANPLGWYAAFIDGVILPIRGIFAPVQLIGEFLLGLFLVLGIFTPLTSVMAGFFILNTFLATFGHDWPWSYVTILGILFVVFMSKAGRSIGVDSWLLKQRGDPPGSILW
jgi:uncharacterized membrane protein YphA (DoxX/SURF4 family)